MNILITYMKNTLIVVSYITVIIHMIYNPEFSKALINSGVPLVNQNNRNDDDSDDNWFAYDYYFLILIKIFISFLFYKFLN